MLTLDPGVKSADVIECYESGWQNLGLQSSDNWARIACWHLTPVSNQLMLLNVLNVIECYESGWQNLGQKIWIGKMGNLFQWVK